MRPVMARRLDGRIFDGDEDVAVGHILRDAADSPKRREDQCTDA